jgi:hypothetical protein
MSPPAIAPIGAAKDYKSESTLARLLGSGISTSSNTSFFFFADDDLGSAGIAELAVFHPVCIMLLPLIQSEI